MLTETQKMDYESNVWDTLYSYSTEQQNTQFEISIDTFDGCDGWEYEEELGEIFDRVYKEYLEDRDDDFFNN